MGKGIDLTKKKFGRWMVIKWVGRDKRGKWQWLCRCVCGREGIVMGSNLRRGNSKGCKSCQISRNNNKKRLDLVGKKFGKWTVLKWVGRDKRKRWLWLCICECGKKKNILGAILISGNSKGCRSCKAKIIFTKHGMSKARLYRIWKNMISRCENPNKTFYKNYGGRGIKVCAEWNKDFVAFKDWALENGYKDDLTIDRIDNDGNYSPRIVSL